MLNPGCSIRVIIEEIEQSLLQVDAESIDVLEHLVISAQSVFTMGIGRSGLMARAFAMRVMHLGKRAFVVGETTTPAIGSGDLLVACSGSGKTPFVCQAAETAKSAGATVAAVTGSRDSRLAKVSDTAIVVPRVADSRQFGGSLFEQCLLVLLDSVVMKVKLKMRETDETMTCRHANIE